MPDSKRHSIVYDVELDKILIAIWTDLVIRTFWLDSENELNNLQTLIENIEEQIAIADFNG